MDPTAYGLCALSTFVSSSQVHLRFFVHIEQQHDLLMSETSLLKTLIIYAEILFAVGLCSVLLKFLFDIALAVCRMFLFGLFPCN